MLYFFLILEGLFFHYLKNKERNKENLFLHLLAKFNEQIQVFIIHHTKTEHIKS